MRMAREFERIIPYRLLGLLGRPSELLGEIAAHHRRGGKAEFQLNHCSPIRRARTSSMETAISQRMP